MKKWVQAYEGDSIRPYMKDYGLRCCDCGLVHKLDFFVIKNSDLLIASGYHVQFRVRRDARATAASRRSRKYRRK